MIGATHAGCFNLALAIMLEQSGYSVDHLHTIAKVSIDKADDGYKITNVELDTEGRVPGCDQNTFMEKSELAKGKCPVFKALTGVKITLRSRFIKAAA